MRGFLPDEICRAHQTTPATPPAAGLCTPPGSCWDDHLSSENVRRKGYFNPRFISRVLEDARQSNGADAAGIVIVAFFVQLWDDIFLN